MADGVAGDLSERIVAAKALNRLAHALVRHRADRDVLLRIGREAERLATDIEGEPVRERRMELLNAPEFERAVKDGGPLMRAEGAFVDMFEDSPVSGSANPLSIGLQVGRDGNDAVGRVTLAAGWQGAPERAHGGVVAAIVDEVMGAVLPMEGILAFTGELTCRYLAPTPMGSELEFRARKVGRERSKLFIECEGTSADGQFMRAHATFIVIDIERFQAMSLL